MRSPQVSLILFETKELSYILRVTLSFESGHILAAGHYESPAQVRIDGHYHPGYEVLLPQLLPAKAILTGQREVPPYKGGIGYFPGVAHRYWFAFFYAEMVLQVPLTHLLGTDIVVNNVQGIIIPVLGIDPVCGEPTSQAIGTLVHSGYGSYDGTSIETLGVAVYNSGNGTAAWDPDFSFPF